MRKTLQGFGNPPIAAQVTLLTVGLALIISLFSGITAYRIAKSATMRQVKESVSVVADTKAGALA